MFKVVETAAQKKNITMQMRLHPVMLRCETGCGSSKTLFYQAVNLYGSEISTTCEKEHFLLTDA